MTCKTIILLIPVKIHLLSALLCRLTHPKAAVEVAEPALEQGVLSGWVSRAQAAQNPLHSV